MKKILFFLMAFSLLSACSSSEEASRVDFVSPPVLQKKNMETEAKKQVTQKGTTVFSFSEKQTILLTGEEEKEVSVQMTPAYEPITSVQVKLLFDPKKITITKITPASKVTVLESVIDLNAGAVDFIAAAPNGIFGENVPLFLFSTRAAASAEKGETSLKFDTSSTHALLPDVHNTDTALHEDMPVLIFSVL